MLHTLPKIKTILKKSIDGHPYAQEIKGAHRKPDQNCKGMVTA
jgi:hypothetical protein